MGAFSVSATGSVLLRGDAPPADPRISSALPVLSPRPAHAVKKRPKPKPKPVPARRAPAFKIHDVRPDAPPRSIALTIDDGPSREWTPKVLALLERHDVQATFCVIGQEVRRFPELLREIVAAGHQVANHTMHHPVSLARLPARRIEAEIRDAHRYIQDVGGTTPKLFRAPGGNWSPAVMKTAAKHGMLPIDWDIDPRDWARPGATRITRSLLRGKAGDILLCHDGGGDRSQTLNSLRKVIPRLKDRGLEFIAL
ncbi:polysaccharide deacetylase family protein [Actinomadura sp. HBU206391]|uniref:polysaccharide deacetylase family protein n=1 Tax=Actinomadura sp. HBU206391 TaxID=2731692 RepID=UPI0021C91357|nr:polysaccharide deacetylase family protein [Actinomadura sp. HBU206391]